MAIYSVVGSERLQIGFFMKKLDFFIRILFCSFASAASQRACKSSVRSHLQPLQSVREIPVCLQISVWSVFKYQRLVFSRDVLFHAFSSLVFLFLCADPIYPRVACLPSFLFFCPPVCDFFVVWKFLEAGIGRMWGFISVIIVDSLQEESLQPYVM